MPNVGLWCARRAVAFAAISIGCLDHLSDRVHFKPKSTFQKDRPSSGQSKDCSVPRRDRCRRPRSRLRRRGARCLALAGEVAPAGRQAPAAAERFASGARPCGTCHVLAEAEANVAHLKGQVHKRTDVRWKRPHRVAAPDDGDCPLEILWVGRGWPRLTNSARPRP
jgi:hypothetical protein